jgi:hypothetical protein
MTRNTRHTSLVWRTSWNLLSFALLALMIGQQNSYGQAGPAPPCGTDPIPDYPLATDSAIVKAWHKSDVGAGWSPPPCTGWAPSDFATLVTISARLRTASDAQDWLRRIGSISQLAGVRYWSTTRQRWRTLILDAYALPSAQSGQRRGDFQPGEMTEGKVLYFEQTDNLSGKATYSMRIVAASPDRIVVEIENVITIRYLLVPLFHPGDLQSIYFMDRESPDVWRFYSIVRTAIPTSRLLPGNESSAINRAVAFYRHMIGIPTDQEPPAAR